MTSNVKGHTKDCGGARDSPVEAEEVRGREKSGAGGAIKGDSGSFEGVPEG